MENTNFIENMATKLALNASVKNVYGEPIVHNGKTIIPVAQVSYGFGGGFGQKGSNHQQADAPVNGAPKEEEGGGGGGGLKARAKGVYEITDQGTRFIPVGNPRPLLLAGIIGFLLSTWIAGRRNGA